MRRPDFHGVDCIASGRVPDHRIGLVLFGDEPSPSHIPLLPRVRLGYSEDQMTSPDRNASNVLSVKR